MESEIDIEEARSKEVAKERLLIHGPFLNDLTDLLYFDKIVYPTTMVMMRPRNLAPGYAGYPAKEPLPEMVRDKLSKAGLIVPPAEVLFMPGAVDFAAQLSQGTDTIGQWIQESGSVIAETATSILHTPASVSEESAWLRDIDAKTKRFSDFVIRQGQRAVPKYYIEDITRTLKPGWTIVLSITFLQFPGINMGRLGLAGLDELSHTGTKERRQALFDWPMEIEAAVAKRQLSIDKVPQRIGELLDNYGLWIKESGFPIRPAIAEFLLIFSASFINRLMAIDLPGDIRKLIALSPRGLSLTDEDMAVSGREVGYLCHYKRDI